MAEATQTRQVRRTLILAPAILERFLGESDSEHITRLGSYGFSPKEIDKYHPGYSLRLEAEREEYMNGMASD